MKWEWEISALQDILVANQVAAITVLEGATTPPEKLGSGGGMNTNFSASIFLLFLSDIL